MYRLSFSLLLLCLLPGLWTNTSALSREIVPEDSTIFARTDNPFKEADYLTRQGQFEEALQHLQQLRRRGPGTAELLWRMAYVRIYLGKRASDRKQAWNYYKTALRNSEEAVATDTQNAMAYAIKAMAAGRASLAARSNRQKIELSRVVKKSADRAIALDPGLDLAYHVRGRWHYRISTLGFFTRAYVDIIYGGFPDATVENAVVDLKRAIQLHDRIAHRLYLGIAYQKLDRRKKAVSQLERILQMPIDHPDDPKFKRKARSLLEDIR